MRKTKYFFKRKVEYTPGWGLGLTLNVWADADYMDPYNVSLMIQFIYGKFFIRLPLNMKMVTDDMLDRYGIHYYTEGQAIFFEWGKSHIWYLPWSWEFKRHTIWDVDGKDVSKEAKNVYGEELHKLTKAQTYDYTYVLKSGEVQHRKATIYVEEREWRWKWLMWSKWPRLIRKTIDVQFSDEVGERSGSWKGGTIGCGYDMLPNETPEQCLRRMEKERKF